MNGPDYGKNIDIYEAELEKLNEKLTEMDPMDDDYTKVVDAIRKLNETKLTEHKAYVEHLESLKKIEETKVLENRAEAEKRDAIVPKWVAPLASIAVNAGAIIMIYRGELQGKVIGSAAISMLNKIRFPSA